MNIKEFWIKSSDEKNLFFREWLPNKVPSAVICIIHGLGDHSGWYDYLVKYFTDNNFAVLSFDLRGHGKSDGKRGHSENYEILMKDMDLLYNYAQKNFKNLPIYFYGHSFGGNLTINYILRRKPKYVKGVIASAPWLELATNPSALKLSFMSLAKKIYPSFSVESVVDTSVLSHDAEALKTYAADPLVHGDITVSLFINACNAGKWAINHAHEFNIPLLIMHGDSDKITSFNASKKFAERTGKNICTFKNWHGLYHSLHNEINRDEIYTYILDWITITP